MFKGLLEYLKKNLPQKIIDGKYNRYEIFGKEAETPISDTIEEFFNLKSIEYVAYRAPKKNDFPDLKIQINEEIYAFEHKSGICNFKGEKREPENDLGTLNAYSEKIKKYGDNIYCTFVKYSVLKNDTIQIEDIYFDKIYTFVGKRGKSDNLLKYRKKDGNLRPKKWDDMANNVTYFSTLEDFEKALEATISYRSKEIVIQHLENLDDTSLRDIKCRIDEKLND